MKLDLHQVFKHESRLVAIDSNDREILRLAAEIVEASDDPQRVAITEQLWALYARPGILAVAHVVAADDGEGMLAEVVGTVEQGTRPDAPTAPKR